MYNNGKTVDMEKVTSIRKMIYFRELKNIRNPQPVANTVMIKKIKKLIIEEVEKCY